MHVCVSFFRYVYNTLRRVLQVMRESKTDYVTSVRVCVYIIRVNCMHTTHTL